MAWRIDESVIRGEIDNRTRGRVLGRIWFVGRETPVELDLAGNAWRDLAGRRLTFVNPDPKPGELKGLGTFQSGVIGDCTASRKVKVPEVSMDELMKLFEQRKPFPWHWGNSLYLEWFSSTNGRVVIESATFRLTIASDIAWEMTPAEEKAQRGANAEAMENFMGRLGEAVAGESAADAGESETAGAEGSEEKPLSEAEAEKMQEEALQNPDPELEARLDRKHPLAVQAYELSLRLRKEPEARGWLPDDAGEEHPLVDLGAAAMKAGAKFAGALNGRAWPPAVELCGNTIVRLKRARGYLDDALLAAEACGAQNLAEANWLVEMRRELNALGHECDLLIGELRARLARGFD